MSQNMSNYPNGFLNGVSIRNTPILTTYPGKVFWVSSVVGSDTSQGTQELPYATLTYALSMCTTGNGDIVVLMPGHAETITAAGGVTISKNNVAVLAPNGATFTFTTSTAATFLISGDNVVCQGIKAYVNLDQVVSPFVVTGDNPYLDITVQDAADNKEAVTGVLMTTVATGYLKLKYLGRTGGSNCTVGVKLNGCSDITIDIDAYGKASTAWVNFVTAACTDINVSGYMYNSGTTSGAKDIVDTITGSTWFGVIQDGSAGATFSGGSAAAWATDDVSTIASNQAVATVDGTANTLERDVVGNKTDAGVQAVTTNKSLMGYLKGVLDILAGTAGIASFPSAAAAANSVSVAEVIRYSQDTLGTLALDRNASNYLSVTADFTSATWNTVAAHEIATVTGMVHLIIIPEVTGSPTSAGSAATLILGDETTTNSIITSTDAENLATGEVWFDSTDTRTLAASSIYEKTNIVVGGGKDIGYTIGTEALTGGSIVFHMWWRPISATGAVAAGSGGPL